MARSLHNQTTQVNWNSVAHDGLSACTFALIHCMSNSMFWNCSNSIRSSRERVCSSNFSRSMRARCWTSSEGRKLRRFSQLGSEIRKPASSSRMFAGVSTIAISWSPVINRSKHNHSLFHLSQSKSIAICFSLYSASMRILFACMSRSDNPIPMVPIFSRKIILFRRASHNVICPNSLPSCIDHPVCRNALLTVRCDKLIKGSGS